MENININGYQFENEQAYIAMELTKAWLDVERKRCNNYITEEEVGETFCKIYKIIGKAPYKEG